MDKKCKRCQWEIKELHLSKEQRLEIWEFLIQGREISAIQKLKDDLKLSLVDAKGAIHHLNAEFGKCVNCNFDELTGENTECPKCKAFNYNLNIETSFNKEFCEYLEYKLDFNQLKNEEVKGFWCDGVDHLPDDIRSLSKQNLERNREIITKAWIGKRWAR